MLYEDAVHIAAKVLDRRDRSWYKHIDCNKLNMLSGTRCILGQLYGDYGSRRASNVINEVRREVALSGGRAGGIFSTREAGKWWVHEIKARLGEPHRIPSPHPLIDALDLRRPVVPDRVPQDWERDHVRVDREEELAVL